jgi:hypothetical protein
MGGSVAIKEGVLEMSSEDIKTVIEIPFGSYSFEQDLWQGLRIKTSYTDKEIEWMLKKTNLQIEVPKNIKGKTEVLFDIEFSKDQFLMSGYFGEGTYVWKGQEVFIKEAKWFYDKNRLDFDVTFPFLGSEFTVHSKIYPGDTGPMIIEGFEKGVEERALYIECSLFDVDGLSIQKMQGNLFGLEFEFLPINKMEDFLFLGDIKIDADLLGKVVGPDVRELIEELKFHKGYELKGELQIKKDNLKESYFEGY